MVSYIRFQNALLDSASSASSKLAKRGAAETSSLNFENPSYSHYVDIEEDEVRYLIQQNLRMLKMKIAKS